jgi:hypothetical protein
MSEDVAKIESLRGEIQDLANWLDDVPCVNAVGGLWNH